MTATTINESLLALYKPDNWSLLDTAHSRYAAAYLTEKYTHINEEGVVFLEPSIVLDEDIAGLLQWTTTEVAAVLFVNGLKELARLGLIELCGVVIWVREEFVELLQVQAFQHEIEVRA